MSAGNLFGAIWNTVILGALWVVLGAVIDKIFRVFNTSISVLPTLQDAAHGMSLMKTGYTAIMIVVFIVIWANYMLNESSQASGGV